jgi:predicted transglutaminase-like cysteine proteinase
MLYRVTAWTIAAVLAVWPVRSGIDAGTLDEFSAVPAALTPANAQVQDLVQDRVQKHLQDQAQAQDEPGLQVSDQTAAVAAPPSVNIEAQDHSAIDDEAAMPTAALDPAPPVQPSPLALPLAEPFGLAAIPVDGGDVVTKWNGVEARIRADNAILARCRDDEQHCPKAAQNFLAIVAQGRKLEGRTRIGVINRAVNLAIEPMSDMAQWGVPDRWSPPLETFTTGRGDCEDYAIAKYVALTAAGVAAADVKLVIVRNLAVSEDHAVAAVRIDGDWIVLDNRWLTMVEDVDMPKVIPLFVLDDQGVKRFTPPALISSRQTASPASVGF